MGRAECGNRQSKKKVDAVSQCKRECASVCASFEQAVGREGLWAETGRQGSYGQAPRSTRLPALDEGEFCST